MLVYSFVHFLFFIQSDCLTFILSWYSKGIWKGQPQLVLILSLKSGQNPGLCSYKVVLIRKECIASLCKTQCCSNAALQSRAFVQPNFSIEQQDNNKTEQLKGALAHQTFHWKLLYSANGCCSAKHHLCIKAIKVNWIIIFPGLWSRCWAYQV